MKKTLWLLACFGFFICIAAKCGKDAPPIPEEEKLPPFTTTGVEKLGCLINGKAWVTGAPYFLSNPNTAFNIDTIGKYINLFAKKEPDYKRLSIYSNYHKLDTGDYKINYNQLKIFLDDIKCNSNPYYELDTTRAYTLKIKFLDKQKRIVAGEFEFTAINKTCKDTVKLTEGRFDLKFNYW